MGKNRTSLAEVTIKSQFKLRSLMQLLSGLHNVEDPGDFRPEVDCVVFYAPLSNVVSCFAHNFAMADGSKYYSTPKSWSDGEIGT